MDERRGVHQPAPNHRRQGIGVWDGLARFLGILEILFCAIFALVFLFLLRNASGDGNSGGSGEPVHDLPPTLSPVEYKYEPLETDQITRILCLHPGQLHESLEADMRPIHDTLDYAYTSYSYVWGAQKYGDSIHVHNMGGQGGVLNITQNVGVMLREARDPQQPVCVWVDALSINQANSTEKSLQIPSMLRFYLDSQKTIIHLTPDPGASMKALSDLALFAEGYNSGHFNDENLDYKDILALLKNPWFMRTWVVQEAASPEILQLSYGGSLEWSVFSDGVRNLMRCGLRKFRTPEVKKAVYMIDLVDELQRNGQLFSMDLFQQLCRTRGLDATNARDKIYAPYGLGWDSTKRPGLNIDYTRSVENTYKEAAVWDGRRNGPRMFSLLTGPEQHPDLPSWTPDFRKTSVIATPFSQYHGSTNFRAAERLPEEHRVQFAKGVMHATGIVLVTVKHLTQSACITPLVDYTEPDEQKSTSAQCMLDSKVVK